jgi:hypothetical protein
MRIAPRPSPKGLRRHGIDVTTTPEAGLLGATDEEQTAREVVARSPDLATGATEGLHATRQETYGPEDGGVGRPAPNEGR